MSLEAGPSNASDSPRRRSWWGGLATGSVKSRGKQPDQEVAEDGEEVMLSESIDASREAGSQNQRGQPPAYDTLATSVPSDVKPRARLKKSSKGARGAAPELELVDRGPAGRSDNNVMAVTTQTVSYDTIKLIAGHNNHDHHYPDISDVRSSSCQFQTQKALGSFYRRSSSNPRTQFVKATSTGHYAKSRIRRQRTPTITR